MTSYFLPLKDLLAADLIPADIARVTIDPAVLDRIGIVDYGLESISKGVYLWLDLGFRKGEGEESAAVLTLPQFPELALVLEDFGRLEMWFEEDWKVRFSLGKFDIRLPSNLLKPVKETADGTWEPDLGRDFVEVSFDYSGVAEELPDDGKKFPFILSFERLGGFTMAYPLGRTDSRPLLPSITQNGPAMIMNTGIVLDIKHLSLDLNPDDPIIRLDKATVILPQQLAGLMMTPDIFIEDAILSRRGVSGFVAIDWPLSFDATALQFQYQLPRRNSDGTSVVDSTGNVIDDVQEAKIFGVPGGLRHIGARIEQNRLTASDVSGSMVIPYFDEPVDIRLNIAPDGSFAVTLLGSITVTKKELLVLSIQSLMIARDDDDGKISLMVSGSLQPLLVSSQGLKWPELEVKDLRITSDGKISIGEAWLELDQLATLDLWGFKLELTRLGIGMDDPNQRMWLDLAGSLRLMDQLPVGLDIEGFKLTWPQDITQLHDEHPDPLDFALELSKQVTVDFKGVELFYGIPKAVEFSGLIKFFKDKEIVGFSGDMALRVPASGFGAQAGLLIGFNQEAPPYPFLYLYFGIDLPAGIPLGQSGLALKAAMGMFGINVIPDKTAEQNWYYDWYKRKSEGAYQTTKWMPARDALALGVGVTITTADGYVKGTRGLLVLSLPGPVLMIEGRALLLDGLSPDSEPPLKALAVFDGNQGTVQFNIEAEAELIKDVVEAYAMAEAFFDFNNVTRWHLYLGQDQPDDRRIRADILKFGKAFLFKADTYFMFDMVGADTLRSRMGVFVGFKPAIPDIGPVKVELDATLQGEGEVTVRPEQFSGGIDLDGTLKLSVFDVGIQIGAKSNLTTEGPLPFNVTADIDVHADLPWPLEPVDAKVHFEWSLPEPPKIEPPLSLVTLGSRFSSTWVGLSAGGTDAKTELYNDDPVSEWKRRAEASPEVAMDSQVILEFTHEMNSAFFARHPDGEVKHFDAGYIRFVPTLTNVQLFECQKDQDENAPDDESAWTLVAEAGNSERARQLPGVWTAGSEPSRPEAPSTRRLQLWTDNPLLHTGVAPGLAVASFLGAVPRGKPLAGRILDDHPDLMKPLPKDPPPTCVTFNKWSGQTKNAGEVLYTRGAALWANNGRISFPKLEDQCQKGKPLTSLIRLRNRLLGRTKTETSLVPIEDLVIRFPEPVTEVTINLCQPRKPQSAQSDVAARRGVDRPEEVTDYLQKNGDADARAAWKAFLDQIERSKHNRLTSQAAEQLWDKLAREARSILGGLEERLACAKSVPIAISGNSCEWVIRCASDGDAFSCLTFMGLKGVAISQLCWITKSDKDQAGLSREQAKANSASTVGALEHSLQQKCFYRLVVSTELKRSVMAPAGSALETLYAAISNLLNDALGSGENEKKFSQTTYFQTKLPPSNLRSYVKGVFPESGFLRHFSSEDVSLRFLRPHVSTLFADSSQQEVGLRFAARDPSGKILLSDQCAWSKAQDATLFAEEQVWLEYRQDLGWHATPDSATDDVLTGKFSGPNKLAANTRYDLLLVAENTPPNEKNLSVFFQSRFITSAFDTFGELKGYEEVAESAPEILSFDAAFPIDVDPFVTASQAFAEASQALADAQFQHRLDRLEEGRAGLEKAKSLVRERKAFLEDELRSIAMAISPSRLFATSTTRVSLAVIRSTQQPNDYVGIWIKAPESLDLQMSSVNGQTIGRTTWELSKNGVQIDRSELGSLFDLGNRHLIILMRKRPMSSGVYRLKLTRLGSAAEQVLGFEFRIP